MIPNTQSSNQQPSEETHSLDGNDYSLSKTWYVSPSPEVNKTNEVADLKEKIQELKDTLIKERKDYEILLGEKNKLEADYKHLVATITPVAPNIATQQHDASTFLNVSQTIFLDKIKKMTIYLPNGTVDKNYQHQFFFEDLDAKQMLCPYISNCDKIGLTFNSSTFTLSGKPHQAGEYTLLLQYKIGNNKDTVYEKQLKLIINPNPQSLWKDIPTDNTIIFYKPDQATFSQINDTNKYLIAASQRGRSHAHEGKPRDDDFYIHFDPISKWHVLVVADGAGSAKYARQGAAVACESVGNFLKYHLPETIQCAENDMLNVTIFLKNLLVKAAYQGLVAINEEVKKLEGSQLRDFATTIVFCITKKTDSGWLIASFGIGDSPCIVLNKTIEGLLEVSILHYPEEGEFSSQTYFLTMTNLFNKDISQRVTVKLIQDINALVLMTDGIYDPKFQTRNNLEKLDSWQSFWEDMNSNVNLNINNKNAEQELLRWLDFWSSGNHDDRTIAMLINGS